MANFIKEDEIDKLIESGHVTPVNIPPALPSNFAALTNPYPAGSIPLQMQYAPDLLNTQTRGGSIPQIRLMPVMPAGQPSVNSASQNATAPVQKTATQAQTMANTANTNANAAQATATTAATGVTTINSQTAVALVAGQFEQVPISTLDAISLTPTLDNLLDGPVFGRVVNIALTANQIDSTKSGFLATGGSTVPQIIGTVPAIFSYTSTTTTVTVTWSSFTVFFANNTTATIASGSVGPVTGLTASTTYYFYPYLDPTNTVQFAAVTGGLGSPAILYNPQSPAAAQAINLQQNTALSNGGIQAITPSSGAGGGHGGGSGICLKAGQYIESQTRGIIPIETVEPGELIRGRKAWTEVVAKKVVCQNHFIKVTASNGESVSFTPTHATTAIRDGVEQSIPAAKLTVADFLITRDAYVSIKSIEHVDEESLKVQLSCHPEHEFFCSESKTVSILVHNAVPIS
jgi:hypothetical protein